MHHVADGIISHNGEIELNEKFTSTVWAIARFYSRARAQAKLDFSTHYIEFRTKSPNYSAVGRRSRPIITGAQLPPSLFHNGDLGG
jgi:hypothetical protein